ncbi:thioredoxin domain-containing protein [Flavobacterium sp.]|uniref:thioredoxin domain-containing protein n=1 Tax=Flavobacterium sp. TaxID=239 RepID=UPI002FDAAA85
MANTLHLESSPYLLQHASNPIHWKSWSNEQLHIAQNSNKLVVVSIGYSACHWCHVMEHETFEDQHVAKIMNTSYISIKVDREERPDIDAIYMKAVQIMTGRGGWPLNVVCLPDGRPIWGGTYFKKDEWCETLEQLIHLYTNNREKVEEYAEKLTQGIGHLDDLILNTPQKETNSDHLNQLLFKWEKSFDKEFGGNARSPKFMMPNSLQFLMQYGTFEGNKLYLDHVDLTLTKMAYGGIFDTVAGGFCRYAVDLKWHIPHFEKMAYDNGQLLSLYALAYKRTSNELYKNVVIKTISFIENNWLNNKGGFYSALDADSLNPDNELEEGAYYVWEKAQLITLFSKDFHLFTDVFNINDFGHWEDSKYVLIQNQPLNQIALKHQISLNELTQKKEEWEKILLHERHKRSKPRLDNKCITSWNAIVLLGLTDAFKAIGDKRYLDLAIQNGEFITRYLWSSNGNLFHIFTNDTAKINGFLEDYAHVILGFCSLYECTLNESWVHHSKNLMDYCIDHFYDEKKEFFRFISNTEPKPIVPHYEIEDNVIPSSNSVLTHALLKLSVYYNNSYYEKLAQQMISKVIPNADYASAYSNWFMAYQLTENFRKEIAVCGPNALEWITQINAQYLPNCIVSGQIDSSSIPFLKDKLNTAKTSVYICQNKTCMLPIEDIHLAMKVLRE